MYEAFSIHLDDILLYLCPFRVSYLLLVFRTKSTKCVYFHENPPVGRRNQYKRQSWLLSAFRFLKRANLHN